MPSVSFRPADAITGILALHRIENIRNSIGGQKIGGVSELHDARDVCVAAREAKKYETLIGFSSARHAEITSRNMALIVRSLKGP